MFAILTCLLYLSERWAESLYRRGVQGCEPEKLLIDPSEDWKGPDGVAWRSAPCTAPTV